MKTKIKRELNSELEEYKNTKNSELNSFLRSEKEKAQNLQEEKLKNLERLYKISAGAEDEELSVENLKLENKFSELEIIKNRAEKEIENQEKNICLALDLKKENSQLKAVIDIIIEKYQIEKKNIERKYENELKDIEKEEEKKILIETENSKLKIQKEKEDIEKQIKKSNMKILDEFKKVLDEDYNTRLNEIKIYEEESYRGKLNLLQRENDKNLENKIFFYKNEFKEIEKSFYGGKQIFNILLLELNNFIKKY